MLSASTGFLPNVNWQEVGLATLETLYIVFSSTVLGYLLGLPHRVSLARLKKDAVACTECGACYEACPMGIRSVFTLREGKNERAIDVTTADCIFCGECIRRCPEDGALFMSLAGIRVYQASRMQFMKDYASRKQGEKHE